MSKHALSPSAFPSSKRAHTIHGHGDASSLLPTTFDNSLNDELLLHIFTYLSHQDLCRIQPTNRTFWRLTADNQLWRSLYLREFGRTRLRGGQGFIGRRDGRVVRPLPGRAKVFDTGAKHQQDEDERRDWKWMFRISSNWKRGRCRMDDLSPNNHTATTTTTNFTSSHLQTHILLAGPLTITASAAPSSVPIIALVHADSSLTHNLRCIPQRPGKVHITALSLDQSPPRSENHFQLAVFLSSGEFSIFRIDHASPSQTIKQFTYLPRSSPVHQQPTLSSARTAPIIQAAYHHPLLATLSESFHLSLYDLSPRRSSTSVSVANNDNGDTIMHAQTLTSFTSFTPASLVLSAGTAPRTWRLVLAYATPVYPEHWSVGATQLIISKSRDGHDELEDESDEGEERPPVMASAGVGTTMSVQSSRTVRAIDVPHGWIDAAKLEAMRAQWGRRVERVGGTQTDGRWVVLAPSTKQHQHQLPSSSSSLLTEEDEDVFPFSSSSPSITVAPHGHTFTGLQLYRLTLPASAQAPAKMTFVRTLYGQVGSVCGLALSDGRCVSLGVNGSIWVWDLEAGTGAEVDPGVSSWTATSGGGAVAYPYRGGLAGDTKGSVVFDDRRIVSASPGGKVIVRRFDI